jgi:FlaA1/EpsC-like NDP-sugar epimerase
LRRIVSLCEETGKQFRTLPGIWELIEGRVSIKGIRKVHMEDLLDREEIHLDEGEIRQYLKDKRILITGAGGSIGGELVMQICRFHPRAIAFIEFSEENLFKIAMECKQRFEFIPTSEFLLDIKNRASVGRAFREFNPDVVFHAAAYKHVPMQELNPWETAFNNISGTRNLVEAALENQTERFVLVSTDKAVRPTNVMGATKRVAEMLMECVNENTATRLMAVRFGNVLWSSGSAIPIFQKQISKGVPVTVTHPEITRYFMSISEAAQLILQAGAMGEGGEIFILDMGKSMRIVDLARDLIRLSGFEPERDIPIKFTGLRPGEKLYEELITEGEGIVATNHEKILVIRGNTRDRDVLNAKIDELLTVADMYDATAIKKKLQEIVPEYTPQW